MIERTRNSSRSPVAGKRDKKQEAIQERLKRISGMENGSPEKQENKRVSEPKERREDRAKKPLLTGGETIDREKTCPLLLRMFCKVGSHHRLDEFGRDKMPTNELQVYTWRDATLKELMNMVREVNPEARRDGTHFEFSVVYPNYACNGLFKIKALGTTCSGQSCPDDTLTLQSTSFRTGDYLDVAIMLRPRDRKDSRF